MRSLFTKNAHAMLAGEILLGMAQHDKILQMTQGAAWVTIEGVPQDYWLYAGDLLLLPASRLIVVEAQEGMSRIDLYRDTATRQPAIKAYLAA